MLGPSGSGKTTVLRMIAGFETPTAGTIELGGVDATTQPPFRRDVNTVFQDYALFPHMTVEQNVALRPAGKTVAQARARRTGSARHSTWCACSDFGHAPAQPAVRRPAPAVALARALVNRPRVLLLDEPLGALDLKLREQMQIELKAIQREVGITFVFVTHDQDEALTLCDRLAVFHDGRIEQIGRGGRGVRVAGHPVRRRLRRHVERDQRRGGAGRARIEPGTVAIRPETDPGSAARRYPARRARSACRRRRPRDRLRRRARPASSSTSPAGVTFTALAAEQPRVGAAALERGEQVTLSWHRARPAPSTTDRASPARRGPSATPSRMRRHRCAGRSSVLARAGRVGAAASPPAQVRSR